MPSNHVVSWRANRLRMEQAIAALDHPAPAYHADTTTPLALLRDAIEMQIERARQLQEMCEQPLRKAA